VTAPDLRGHGGSPQADRYRFADFAAGIAQLGSHWDLVVGHSLGGPIVAALLGSGVTTDRAVLLDPVFEIADDEIAAVAADQMTESDPFADPRVYADANPSWHPLDAHNKAMAARAVAAATVRQIMDDNTPWHHASLIDAVSAPVRILGADPSVFTMCPAGLGRAFANRNHVTFDVVAGAGHSIQRDQPGAVLAACLAD
jgi:pimeloyl-ACP methyl ester carboxylesterase